MPGYEDVQVADWNAYIHRGDNWVWSDGIHLTNRGAYRARRLLLALVRPPRGSAVRTRPGSGGGPLDDPCPNPDGTGIATDIRSVYGV